MKAAVFDLDGTRELLARLLPHHGALWGYGTEEELVAHGAHALCTEPVHLAATVADLTAATR
jgi:phosphoglycolate phosphatase-like HAD superfamily hydrolase